MSLGFNATAHSAGWELVGKTQQASDSCALQEAAATLEKGEII